MFRKVFELGLLVYLICALSCARTWQDTHKAHGASELMRLSHF